MNKEIKMGLTGIQIFKLLPKTNCKECGAATCLAFAMNLAAGKAELDSCPHVSDEAREKLAEASAPPIRPVVLGNGVRKRTVGGETVLYRHEKTFYNPTIFAALVGSDIAQDVLKNKLKEWNALQFERVGLNLRPEMIAVKDVDGNKDAFAAVAKTIAETSEFSPILMTEDVDIMKAGASACQKKRPLLYGGTEANIDDMGTLAKDMGLPIGIKAASVDALLPLTEKLAGMGIKDIVLDPGARELKQSLQDLVAIRRSALLKSNRAVGFPTITFPCEMASNLDMETIIAGTFVSKYGSIVVLSDFVGESIFPLLLQRLNIYTDPQRPMTVTQGIYEINNPGENAPVLITTNFALTYFIVSGEIEGSKVPAYLLIKDSEGLSVLTAWAAGKFSGDDVGIFVKKSGIADKCKTRELIIPGYAAAIAGDVEEELPDWKITVGPREAAHLPAFLKERA
ncbi:MAG: Acetyl-CoA decarbonylase/synthase complex subunit gamma [Candidatus Magnetoglobus multicellularis str. Araruama]|uniref:Acetyl-CoA decarbonylase/synthase complex subunit gamma n=1 Tax=Candidatus Magnetoglobus multicellularis str. Araruama TaxID=890399 RepID=A0A1V1PHU6_9BACT|nr:MAG: Acetyl-CoA decarbonylase/synthase complex subunit gamma [Candidatus Magnetoglobus multicellularis str. Araruama]